MKAYVITLGSTATAESSRAVGNAFEVEPFAAVMPATVHEEMQAEALEWTYPWEGESVWNGLRLHPYKTRDRDARMGCFMSHFRLWQRCAAGEERVLILEDDALFMRPLPEDFDMGAFGAVSINDPRGATRKALDCHHNLVRAQWTGFAVADAPWIDEQDVPQGLPGASAYLLQPQMAALLVDWTRKNGAWPNDALACKQNFPGLLGCSTTYYTRVAGRVSTLA